jgi:hypothetical protein
LKKIKVIFLTIAPGQTLGQVYIKKEELTFLFFKYIKCVTLIERQKAFIFFHSAIPFFIAVRASFIKYGANYSVHFFSFLTIISEATAVGVIADFVVAVIFRLISTAVPFAVAVIACIIGAVTFGVARGISFNAHFYLLSNKLLFGVLSL